MRPALVLLMCAVMGACGFAAEPETRPHIVLFLIDDMRHDLMGCAGHAIVKTPCLDRLAATGVRFDQARVTTSICMVSRASILTGQHMARHGITTFQQSLSADAFAQTWPARLQSAGYRTGYVGKYGVGKPPAGAFDFSRIYEGKHWMPVKGGADVHVTEKNRLDALEFLKDVKPTTPPFALTVGFFAPHAEDRAEDQYLPQPESAAAYRNVVVPPPKLASAEAFNVLPEFLRAEKNEGRVRFRKRFDTPEKFQDFSLRYFRLITEVDAAIGSIVARLTTAGVLDKTLIVVIGDNGYFLGERGLADKWYPYEEALRVPFLICDPRLNAVKRGMVLSDRVLNIDVLPTILNAVGLKLSKQISGEDAARFYLDETPAAGRSEFHYEHPVVLGKDRIPRSEALVGKTEKWIRWPDFDREQHFDLTRDPEELDDLARRPEFAAKRADFRKRMAEARTRIE